MEVIGIQFLIGCFTTIVAHGYVIDNADNVQGNENKILKYYGEDLNNQRREKIYKDLVNTLEEYKARLMKPHQPLTKQQEFINKNKFPKDISTDTAQLSMRNQLRKRAIKCWGTGTRNCRGKRQLEHISGDRWKRVQNLTRMLRIYGDMKRLLA